MRAVPTRGTLARVTELGFLGERYPVVRKLGDQEWGELFLARTPDGEGFCVVLRLFPARDPDMQAHLPQIVRAAMRARDEQTPGLLRVLDAAFETGRDGLPSVGYVVFEARFGGSVAELLAASRAKAARIPPALGARIVVEAARALHAAGGAVDSQPLPRVVSSKSIRVDFQGNVTISAGLVEAQISRMLAESTIT